MSGEASQPGLRNELAALLAELDGLAAGFWIVAGDHLIQRAFVGAPSLDPAVAGAFAEATGEVPLDRVDLGIVHALQDNSPAITWARDCPADHGSGHWLRAFGADRSVAVPIEGRGVVSIARAGPGDDQEAARRLREAGLRWLGAGRDPAADPIDRD